MSLPALRTRPALVLLLLVVLVVLVQLALVVAAACHAAVGEGSAAAPTVLAVEQHPDCPGCADEGREARAPTADPGPAACTEHRPCGHEAARTPLATDVHRGPDDPRDGGAPPTPSCREALDPAPAVSAPTTSSRVPAAVAAPVAVLCVDRN